MGLRCILLDDGVNELINRIKLSITVHIGNDWRYDQKKKSWYHAERLSGKAKKKIPILSLLPQIF